MDQKASEMESPKGRDSGFVPARSASLLPTHQPSRFSIHTVCSLFGLVPCLLFKFCLVVCFFVLEAGSYSTSQAGLELFRPDWPQTQAILPPSLQSAGILGKHELPLDLADFLCLYFPLINKTSWDFISPHCRSSMLETKFKR